MGFHHCTSNDFIRKLKFSFRKGYVHQMFAAGLVKTNNSVWTSWHDTCCVIVVRPRYLRKQYNSISTRSVVAEGKLTGIISVSANDRLITVGAYLKIKPFEWVLAWTGRLLRPWRLLIKS